MEITNVQLRDGERVSFDLNLDGKTFKFLIAREALEDLMEANSLQGTALLAAFEMVRNKVLEAAVRRSQQSEVQSSPILLLSKDF